ncbi:unnamed protein product [Brassica oleracea]|uniref:(rape) hypothetical protein n=1 Tax=Brassica napus TaxID=3708 RepID=A0A816KFV9_BRANA|nr:unnamed protein product [Brassica napus]
MGNCISPFTGGLATTSGVKVFTIAELKKATKVFGDQDMIIEESFGGVVRGYIDPKTLSPSKEGLGIAVVVKMCVLRNGYVLKEWLVVDFDFLRLKSHPCLVRLIGYGSNRDYLFLVFEYFPNGSLERHIYRESRPKSLPWEIRLKVSIGAAQGLAFLHSRKSTGLYRGNLTASKILLDPERSTYHMAGDVYSFGVILLEILTGLDNRRIILAMPYEMTRTTFQR